MDHQIDRPLLEEAMEQRMVTDVALSAYHAPGGPSHRQQALHMLLFDGRGIKIIEIVQARHPMSLSPQSCAEMRPDKPSSACDQNVCNHVARQKSPISLSASLLSPQRSAPNIVTRVHTAAQIRLRHGQ
jgi:hypothetical protein